MKSEHAGEVVLIDGHAGPPNSTVPEIIDALVEECAGYSIGNDFHNLFVVIIYASGKWKIFNLQYDETPSSIA